MEFLAKVGDVRNYIPRLIDERNNINYNIFNEVKMEFTMNHKNKMDPNSENLNKDAFAEKAKSQKTYIAKNNTTINPLIKSQEIEQIKNIDSNNRKDDVPNNNIIFDNDTLRTQLKELIPYCNVSYALEKITGPLPIDINGNKSVSIPEKKMYKFIGRNKFKPKNCKIDVKETECDKVNLKRSATPSIIIEKIDMINGKLEKNLNSINEKLISSSGMSSKASKVKRNINTENDLAYGTFNSPIKNNKCLEEPLSNKNQNDNFFFLDKDDLFKFPNNNRNDIKSNGNSKRPHSIYRFNHIKSNDNLTLYPNKKDNKSKEKENFLINTNNEFDNVEKKSSNLKESNTLNSQLHNYVKNKIPYMKTRSLNINKLEHINPISTYNKKIKEININFQRIRKNIFNIQHSLDLKSPKVYFRLKSSEFPVEDMYKPHNINSSKIYVYFKFQ